MTTLNERKLALLRLVRSRIEIGTSKHVCVAMLMIIESGRVDLKDARLALQIYIDAELGGRATLDSWRRRRDGFWRGNEEMRVARLKWIDWMIEQLEAP